MIVYNVTIAVEPSIEEQFILWLKETHLPEVMETRCFISHEIFKVFDSPNSETHSSYAVQYRLKGWEDFEAYQNNFAQELQQKTIDLFGENVLAFRTFLEKQE
ncbi:MAG: DUF4286 family protein [Bacteroidia bacterium]